MASLRRGVARYADGTPDVSAPDASQVPTPAPAPVSGLTAFRQLLGDAIGMRGQAARDAAFGSRSSTPAPVSTVGPPSGVGQLFSGDYGGALDNPQSSAATRALAGFMNDQEKAARIGRLQQGPLGIERVINFFGGNAASDKVINDRIDAANTFNNPAIQQHLMNNPDEISMAEHDPVSYANTIQLPQFQQMIQASAAAHAAANNPNGINGRPVVNPTKTANTIIQNNVSPEDAHLATDHHQYSDAEFVDAVSKMPTKTALALFGPYIQRAAGMTTQEQVARQIFNTIGEKINKATAAKEALEAQDKVKNKAKIDEWEAQRVAAIKEFMEYGKQYGGITQRGFAMPLEPQE